MRPGSNVWPVRSRSDRGQIDDASTGRDGKIGTHVDDALAFNADNRPRDRLGADTIDQTIGLNDD